MKHLFLVVPNTIEAEDGRLRSDHGFLRGRARRKSLFTNKRTAVDVPSLHLFGYGADRVPRARGSRSGLPLPCKRGHQITGDSYSRDPTGECAGVALLQWSGRSDRPEAGQRAVRWAVSAVMRADASPVGDPTRELEDWWPATARASEPGHITPWSG